MTDEMSEVSKEVKPEGGPPGQRERSPYFSTIIAVSAVAVFAMAAFGWTEWLRYRIALKRIDAELAQHAEAEQTERLRIQSSPPPERGTAPTTTQGSEGAGLTLLRETIVKGAPPSDGGPGHSGVWSTAALRGIVDAFAAGGLVAAGEAKTLKDELQKAGIEIGVEAAKGLIDRFIKVHDKPEQKTTPLVQGMTQINMYCGVSPVRTSSHTQPTSPPKTTCSGPAQHHPGDKSGSEQKALPAESLR